MKINASELRIGNWIERNGKQYKASALTIFCIGKGHQPILLTEEWIIKLGFYSEGEGNEGGIMIHNQFIRNYKYELKCFVNFEDFVWLQLFICEVGIHPNDSQSSFIPNKIKFVHQLQNLFFALTGEELKIK